MSLSAKKSLGQNFLKSQKAIQTMISTPHITGSDIVVEIGPGKGALTGPLLETGATVIAFELDPRMIEYVSEKFEEYLQSKKLILVHGDILEIDIVTYTKGKPYKVVANIPYYITNLIIRRFLSGEQQPTDMCLLVQKEVAERIVARDNKSSILSLSVQLYGIPSYTMKVRRAYFSPSPKVDSAIILMSEIGRTNISSDDYEKAFFNIIKTAFGQKRKQAIKNLQKIKERQYWETLFSQIGIPHNARAEDISFIEWKEIVSYYLPEKRK